MNFNYIVEPNETGNPVFGYFTGDKISDLPSVTTGKCHRCFGGMILMQKKEEYIDETTPQYMLIAYHIVPGKRAVIREEVKILRGLILSFTPFFKPVSMMRAGGRLDNQTNTLFYREMKNKIEGKIKHLFPNLLIEGHEPQKMTWHMTINFSFDSEKQEMSMNAHHYLFNGKQA